MERTFAINSKALVVLKLTVPICFSNRKQIKHVQLLFKGKSSQFLFIFSSLPAYAEIARVIGSARAL
jgi:hypothetical protein